MKYLAAYLLLNQGGNDKPSAEDVKALLSSVGVDSEEERLQKLISELKDKTIADLIAEGSTKLASMHVPAPVQEDNHRLPVKEQKHCSPYAKTLKALTSCNSLITPTITAASSQAPLPSIPTWCSPPAPQLSSSGP
ncbi:hypothetical protein PtA15_2A439 [Puccinia triticina]|uniref:60S acidic ribosomal protein P2 n=1 Tax=Puccinia triticina TaxID=208348 RepID=A0ABY7CBI4_9BASI|nr:uncharacterized protein PtA15_2A439 [Puccinia triticina]WAQ82125.1 hypothetical protein PtA15_2A439 [Puccinia triticina]